jgi:hypothetical protein
MDEGQPAFSKPPLASAGLDGVSALLPDKALFLYAYVRKEAVLVPDRGHAVVALRPPAVRA